METETDQYVLDFIASNPPYWDNAAVNITHSKTISRDVKIQFWEAYLVNHRIIPPLVSQSYEGLLLVSEANPPADVMEKAIASTIRFRPLGKRNDHDIIDLAFRLNLNIHNIVKKCPVFETFQYALSKGFVPEHFNYLDAYLRLNSVKFSRKMIKLRFSISPKDTLFSTSISKLASFYFRSKNAPILFECLEARFQAGLITPDYNHPFNWDLIRLNVAEINQLLIDYQYSFTDDDLTLTLSRYANHNLLIYMSQTVPNMSLDNRKCLVYRSILPGRESGIEFSLEDFQTYASAKNKQIFASFLTSTVARRQNSVLGLLAPELEHLIIMTHLGFDS